MKRIYINDYCNIQSNDQGIVLRIEPVSQAELIDISISKDEDSFSQTMIESTFDILNNAYVKYIDCDVKLIDCQISDKTIDLELTSSYYELNRILQIENINNQTFNDALKKTENIANQVEELISNLDKYHHSIRLFKIVLENDVKHYLIMSNEHHPINIKLDLSYRS